MFPRKSRLSRASFGVAASSKRRAATPHFSLSASKEATGYAVVVSKKVAPRSVDRHAIKRRVLAILQAETLPPSLIVYARAGARGLSFTQIKQELQAGLAKVA